MNENNEIASREEIKRELAVEYTLKGLNYCLEHPIILAGVGLSSIIIAACIIVDKKF